jgi:pyruvate,water dikinase
MKTYDIAAMEERERRIRSEAEKAARERLGFVRRAAFFWVVARARKGVKHRENLRFARTKIFGIARHLFRAMGERLVRLGELDEARDVFYLTVKNCSPTWRGVRRAWTCGIWWRRGRESSRSIGAGSLLRTDS